MISIKEETVTDINKVLKYFEPWVCSLTNLFLKDSAEKDDCRQELRLKIWSLFKKEGVYNTAYVVTRLKWDIINFVNRDAGYNWYKTFSTMEYYNEMDREDIFAVIDEELEDKFDTVLELEDIIQKAKPKLTDKQYEALVLYLSGANTEMISSFLGTRNNNITRYYLLLGEAIATLRKVSDGATRS